MPVTPSLFFVGMVAVMGFELSRDVQRAGALERRLHEEERRLALAAEAAHLGIWTRGADGGTLWASPSWRKLFGFTDEESVTIENFLQKIHPDDRALVKEALWNSGRQNHIYELEYRVVRLDGRVVWIASRRNFEATDDGKAGRAFEVSVDVTQRKDAEQRLQEQQAELAHLSRVSTLGELSASLAHEINQPLTAIISNAQAAQRFLNDPDFDRTEIGEILRDIAETGLHAGGVIRSLRGLFKKGGDIHQPLDVNALVRETLKLVRSDVLRRRVTVDLSLAKNAPFVSGDRIQIQQVLLNLILNGVDAMSENSGNRRVLHIRTMSINAGLKVSVEDSGTGIAPHLRDKIFEPFFTTKPQGLGLGLVVCRSILSAHATTLELASSQEGGAEFYFILMPEGAAS